VSTSGCFEESVLVDFVERRLSPERIREVEEHVDGCPSCRRIFAETAHVFFGGSDAPTEETSDRAPAAPARQRLHPGDRVDRYVILDTVGEGGMGVVYAAYDPKLDRKVALKLLRADPVAEHGLELRARLFREAQAMARLSHPNVLPVFEADVFGGQVFIAMEFVEGETLGAWVGAKPRSWREILDVFLKAGEGLAAAHKAGIIHRDFKPDNVLFGADGRVRVTDFGLARTTAGAAVDAQRGVSPDESSEPPVTRTGQLLGTPAFMAPEQIRGEPATPKADQFSFCVALYQGLYDERPFPGSSLSELEAAVQRGEVRASPRGSQVPAWVRRLLLRGLRANPEERFPSMADLLADLRKDPRRLRRRLLVASLALAAAVAVVVPFLTKEEPCRYARHELDEVWNAEHKSAARAAFLATAKPYAGTAWAGAERGLDERARDHRASAIDACEATRVRGTQSETVLALRLECLADQKRRLGALVTEFERADGKVVEEAVRAVAALSSASACSAERVVRTHPAPLPEASRAEVESVRAALARVNALNLSGKWKEGLKAVEPALARAHAIGYAAVEAEALALKAELEERMGLGPQARSTAEKALRVAAAAGRSDIVAYALIRMVAIVGTRQGKHAEALEIAVQAQAALERIGDDGQNLSTFFFYRGASFRSMARYAEALDDLQRCATLRERLFGADSAETAMALGMIGPTLLKLDRAREARPFFERNLSIMERTLGAEHPTLGIARNNAGVFFNHIGDLDRALELFRSSLSIYEKNLPASHPMRASGLQNVGLTLKKKGEYDEGARLIRRSIVLGEKVNGPAHPATAVGLYHLGVLLSEIGEYAEAKRHLQRAKEIADKAYGPDNSRVADFLAGLAVALVGTGDAAAGLTAARHALAINERALGANHRDLAGPLMAVGKSLRALGRAREALAAFLRAKAIQEQSRVPSGVGRAQALVGIGESHLDLGDARAAIPPLEQALAMLAIHPSWRLVLATEIRFALARALWVAGGDRARARSLAEKASARTAHRQRLREAIARWLARNR
jgi:tetratricopeptide (TPR) repeat protein